MNRRNFISQGLLATSSLAINGPLFSQQVLTRLTILHTNDVHSRLDPFPMDGSANAGKGGVAARAKLIQQLRQKNEHVLLLDAGDIFQGTPYFNIFKGEPEMRAMNMMGYDACIMGNHDFDAGMENFVEQLNKHGKFPVLMCNYSFERTPMEGFYQSYKIFKKGGLKIGVTGVGIELSGLVPASLFGNTIYLDPIVHANKVANILKNEKKCDLVICLSHLGDRYDDNKVSDEVFAKQSENIDLIIGGHTHRFFDKPREYTNKNGKKTIVNQVGWGGIQLGRIDYVFGTESGHFLDENQTNYLVENIVE